MKSQMGQFTRLLALNWRKCPWIREQTPRFMLSEMREEIEEVEAELYGKDRRRLEEELGDVAWDYFNLLIILEKTRGVKMRNVFSSLMKKVRHRKPYLFEKGSVTTDEAVRIWKKQKAKERK